MSADKLTHYDVLGVSKYATYEEIKDSFHRLARAKHPDKQRRKNHSNDESDHRVVDSDDNDDKIVAEFRRIQQAWQVLRDEEERNVYDSDLMHKDLQEENKRNGALVLSFYDDLEEAVDEDANERFMVYDCRCGEEIQIELPPLSDEEPDSNKDFEYCKSTAGDGNDILIDCPGCCFVYRIIGR